MAYNPKDERARRFLNLLAFIVLMTSTDGIISKSPEYIMEKYNRYLEGGFVDENLESYGLDSDNKLKIALYIDKWKDQLIDPKTGKDLI